MFFSSEFSFEVFVPLWIILLTLCCWYNPIFQLLIDLCWAEVDKFYVVLWYGMMAWATLFSSIVLSEQILFLRIHFDVLTQVLLYHLIVHKRVMISNAWHPNSRNFEKWLQMSWVHHLWKVLMGPRRLGRVIKNLIWLCAVNFDVVWNDNDICEAISYIYQLMISIVAILLEKNSTDSMEGSLWW